MSVITAFFPFLCFIFSPAWFVFLLQFQASRFLVLPFIPMLPFPRFPRLILICFRNTPFVFSAPSRWFLLYSFFFLFFASSRPAPYNTATAFLSFLFTVSPSISPTSSFSPSEFSPLYFLVSKLHFHSSSPFSASIISAVQSSSYFISNYYGH